MKLNEKNKEDNKLNKDLNETDKFQKTKTLGNYWKSIRNCQRT